MSRIDEPSEPPPVPKPSLRTFSQVLQKRPLKLPVRTLLPTVKTARVPARVISATVLRSSAETVRARVEARTQMGSEVARLRGAREEDRSRDTAREPERLRYFLERELPPERAPVPGLSAELPPEPPPRVTSAAEAPVRTTSPSRAQNMLDLVEKMEVFVKSQRPALALTLGGALGGKMEVERVGPRAVAVRLQSKSGLTANEVAGLRSALAARGLTLARYEAA